MAGKLVVREKQHIEDHRAHMSSDTNRKTLLTERFKIVKKSSVRNYSVTKLVL